MSQVKELSIKDLFRSGEYVIPVYQRNYSWTDKEITQLIQDIADYADKNEAQSYYIGTLVVYERTSNGKTTFETIDGQQRLTTLNLLLSVIKNDYLPEIGEWYKMNLKFDSRPSSNNTLALLYESSFEVLKMNDINIEIFQGYGVAQKSLNKILNGAKVNFANFTDYLSNNVKILRVSVPPDTDLNHYFEIMNNRGEQLEKHEVLKARCLEILKEEPHIEKIFNKIWEACANMERYIQYGFNKEERDAIFGKEDWNCLKCHSIDDVASALGEENRSESSSDAGLSFNYLLENSTHIKSNTSTIEDDGEERFTSVINFSNFLLHVLRIQTRENIPLDDKRLLKTFDLFLKEGTDSKPVEFVKTFGFNLLKCKFLFDKYVLKREYANGNDKWSLKRLKWYPKNKSVGYDDIADGTAVLMLLAMFHVSNPSLIYKHWLNGALKYVFEHEHFSATEYRTYLESLADAFLKDQYLAKKTDTKDFFDIIYTFGGSAQNKDVDLDLLNQGTAVENFIFNYLDYRLWEQKVKDYEKFEFTFRSSVEHHYPQNPKDVNLKLKEDELNNFGNLCLISSDQNSRLRNDSPEEKKKYYLSESITVSLKQRVMMQYGKWGTEEIIEHAKEMQKLLFPD